MTPRDDINVVRPETRDEIQLSFGRLIDWEAADPLLKAGECACIFDNDTLEPIDFKFGNGFSRFKQLPSLVNRASMYTKEEVDDLLTAVQESLAYLQKAQSSSAINLRAAETRLVRLENLIPDDAREDSKLVTAYTMIKYIAELAAGRDVTSSCYEEGDSSDATNPSTCLCPKLFTSEADLQIGPWWYLKEVDGGKVMTQLLSPDLRIGDKSIVIEDGIKYVYKYDGVQWNQHTMLLSQVQKNVLNSGVPADIDERVKKNAADILTLRAAAKTLQENIVSNKQYTTDEVGRLDDVDSSLSDRIDEVKNFTDGMDATLSYVQNSFLTVRDTTLPNVAATANSANAKATQLEEGLNNEIVDRENADSAIQSSVTQLTGRLGRLEEKISSAPETYLTNIAIGEKSFIADDSGTATLEISSTDLIDKDNLIYGDTLKGALENSISSGETPGTVKVIDTEVPVAGLQDAAYHPATDFATQEEVESLSTQVNEAKNNATHVVAHTTVPGSTSGELKAITIGDSVYSIPVPTGEGGAVSSDVTAVDLVKDAEGKLKVDITKGNNHISDSLDIVTEFGLAKTTDLERYATKEDLEGLTPGTPGTPAVDTNTTYEFAEGTTLGAFTVTPSEGNLQTVKVHGLNSAAYQEAAEFAKSSDLSALSQTVEEQKVTLQTYGDGTAQYFNAITINGTTYSLPSSSGSGEGTGVTPGDITGTTIVKEAEGKISVRLDGTTGLRFNEAALSDLGIASESFVTTKLDGKLDKSDVVTTIDEGATTPVTGGAIFTSIKGVLNTLDYHGDLVSGLTTRVDALEEDRIQASSIESSSLDTEGSEDKLPTVSVVKAAISTASANAGAFTLEKYPATTQSPGNTGAKDIPLVIKSEMILRPRDTTETPGDNICFFKAPDGVDTISNFIFVPIVDAAEDTAVNSRTYLTPAEAVHLTFISSSIYLILTGSDNLTYTFIGCDVHILDNLSKGSINNDKKYTLNFYNSSCNLTIRNEGVNVVVGTDKRYSISSVNSNISVNGVSSQFAVEDTVFLDGGTSTINIEN